MKVLINEYKSNISKQLTWFLFIVILGIMVLLAFPIINDPSVEPIVKTNLEHIPTNVSNVIFPLGKEAFSSIELYFKTILVGVSFMFGIYSLNIGLDSLAKEQGYGTIEYLYINPITRGEILTSKFIGNVLNLLILAALLLVAMSYGYAYVIDTDFVSLMTNQVSHFIIIFFNGLLFLSLGTMISAFSNRTSGLGGISAFIIIAFLVLNILISANIVQIPLVEFVPFRTLQETYSFEYNKIIMTLLISKIIPSIIFIAISYIYYDRKDLVI